MNDDIGIVDCDISNNIKVLRSEQHYSYSRSCATSQYIPPEDYGGPSLIYSWLRISDRRFLGFLRSCIRHRGVLLSD